MATNRKRYMISVDDETYKAIEDFRYKRRFPTRSEATQELIRIGLKIVADKGKNSEEAPSDNGL